MRKEQPSHTPRKLRAEYREIQQAEQLLEKEIELLRVKIGRIAHAVPRLREIYQGKYMAGAEYISGPDDPEIEDVPKWYLPEERQDKNEKLASNEVNKLEKKIYTKVQRKKSLRERKTGIRVRAEILGVDLPETGQVSKSASDSKKKKRAKNENVVLRRANVKAVEAANPNMLGDKLDRLTCKTLDKLGVPILTRWSDLYKIDNWKEGYSHSEVKGLIHKMFSDDRRSSDLQ